VAFVAGGEGGMYRIVLCCKTVGHLLIAVLCVDHLHWAVRPLPVLELTSYAVATAPSTAAGPAPSLFTAACFALAVLLFGTVAPLLWACGWAYGKLLRSENFPPSKPQPRPLCLAAPVAVPPLAPHSCPYSPR
jgi:hypothetical protein